MSDVAIQVENLGKLYQIGQREKYKALRDTLTDMLYAPVRAAKSIATGGRRKTEGAGQPSDNTFWALKDVSFEVKHGEVLGIIGRNGAGKSTLLKILSRITEPTEGRVAIHGRVGSLLEVGTGFHPELTGRENIYLNGSILGMKRAELERKFDEIVAFAEVEKFIDTPVKHYSSGMYVRLAFAVAAHLEPEVLIVDEVLAVGDAEFQRKCLGKMGDVARQGRTVLLVSHNMAAVDQICTRVLLIRRGQLCDDGNPSSVISEYLTDASRSESGDFDFSNHPARPKGYEPIVQRLILRSSNGVPTTTFYPDECFEVELVLSTAKPIREPRVAIAIEDNLGRRLMTAASYFGIAPLADLEPGAASVRCIIPRLDLGTGHYLVSVSVATNYGGLLDTIDGAAWFHIDWRNNYGNGEPYNPVYGPVLAKSIWQVEEREGSMVSRAI